MKGITLEELRTVHEKPFDFYTGHVQGITVHTDSFFLSSVDTNHSTGMLFKLSFEDLRLTKNSTLRSTPARYHVGGITVLGDRILAPLAEYGSGGQSSLLLLCPETLEERGRFLVEDHVGAVATDGKTRIVCANWDAVEFIVLNMDGKTIGRIENPTDVAYQDMEWRAGLLYCSGILRADRSKGRIDTYRLKSEKGRADSFSLLSSVPTPQLESSLSLSHEGMTIYGDSLFFLPEDFPNTRIYSVPFSSCIG